MCTHQALHAVAAAHRRDTEAQIGEIVDILERMQRELGDGRGGRRQGRMVQGGIHAAAILDAEFGVETRGLRGLAGSPK